MNDFIPDNGALNCRTRAPDGAIRPVSIIGWAVADGSAIPIFWPSIKAGHTLLVCRGFDVWTETDPVTGTDLADIPAKPVRDMRAIK